MRADSPTEIGTTAQYRQSVCCHTDLRQPKRTGDRIGDARVAGTFMVRRRRRFESVRGVSPKALVIRCFFCPSPPNEEAPCGASFHVWAGFGQVSRGRRRCRRYLADAPIALPTRPGSSVLTGADAFCPSPSRTSKRNSLGSPRPDEPAQAVYQRRAGAVARWAPLSRVIPEGVHSPSQPRPGYLALCIVGGAGSCRVPRTRSWAPSGC
jgi:hypothetical protein